MSACSKNAAEIVPEPTAEQESIDLKIQRLDNNEAVRKARETEASVIPLLQLAEGISLKNWGVDSLIADPIAIDIDDKGRIYYTRTNRQKNSEYDIRAHRDWEWASIQLKDVEEKRAFLHATLAPENSDKNQWLSDLNNDGSHDWRDMKIEKEHVYRVEDKNGDGTAEFSQLVVEDFNDETTDVAGAVLIHGEDLFVGVGPDMWRLRDTNHDGLMDEKLSMAHGFAVHIGFSGHGMSGAELGPDGRIYWGIGDIGFSGKGNDEDGKLWRYPNRGVVARSNPDGTDFEIFAMGVRNTHEFVFDEYANLIGVDNDGDHNGEKERIVYLTNGSDTGWRISWQLGKYRDPDNNNYKVWMDEKLHLPRFEGQPAYITPAVASFVSGPTGMAYNPGTALSPKWRNTFFVAEFNGNPSRSGIHSFKLKPKGATFELSEDAWFVQGILATGMDFGPDGALYFADWIDGWGTKDAGRIWKVEANDNQWPEQETTAQLLPEDFSKKSDADLLRILANSDMRLRQKAQFALVARGTSGLKILAHALATSENQLARIHAIWGISQLARVDAKHAEILLPYLTDSDPEIRAQIAKWLGDMRYQAAGTQLLPLLKDDYSRARFFAAEALGRIAFKPAVQPIIGMLADNNEKDAYLRHAGSLALARIGNADAVVALKNNSSRALRIAAVVALRRMSNSGVQDFLSDADEFIVTEAARAINDDYSIEAALPTLGDLLNNTPFQNEALIRRAINANLRVGTSAALGNLLVYANDENAPLAMRTESLAALGTWVKPSVFDRVDGRARGKIERALAPVQKQVEATLLKIAQHKNPELRLHAVQSIGRLSVQNSSQLLMKTLVEDTNAEVKIAALQTLSQLNYTEIDKAISAALGDSNLSVRVAGLALLNTTQLDDALMVSLLSTVVGERSLKEKQTALASLGKLNAKITQATFENLLRKLADGSLEKGIQLDLIEAIAASKSETLLAQLTVIKNQLTESSLMADYLGTLHGGDAEKGRNIVYRHQTAQCIKCHAFNDYGGTAGPKLHAIGGTINAEIILQALIDPSARIAPGFGYITLKLADGNTTTGLLLAENDTEVIIKIGDNEVTVLQENITDKNMAPSSMPNMQALLSKQEIRDLVAYLSSLK